MGVRLQTDFTSLALECCRISKPGLIDNIPESIRFLALNFLEALVERHWRDRPISKKEREMALPKARLASFGENEKCILQTELLNDVIFEHSFPVCSKRAQILADIARIDTTRWQNLFAVLLPTNMKQSHQQ